MQLWRACRRRHQSYVPLCRKRSLPAAAAAAAAALPCRQVLATSCSDGFIEFVPSQVWGRTCRHAQQMQLVGGGLRLHALVSPALRAVNHTFLACCRPLHPFLSHSHWRVCWLRTAPSTDSWPCTTPTPRVRSRVAWGGPQTMHGAMLFPCISATQQLDSPALAFAGPFGLNSEVLSTFVRSCAG